MNVKLFRLNSGEEILSRFEEVGDSWLLKDPAILIPMQQGQNFHYDSALTQHQRRGSTWRECGVAVVQQIALASLTHVAE